MKRVLIFLLACFLCVSFSACGLIGGNLDGEAVSFPNVNFNNQNRTDNHFCAFDRNFFYQRDGSYDMGTYWNRNGRTVKLFEESDFSELFSHEPYAPYFEEEYYYIRDFFVCGSSLYFILCAYENGDMLYRYDLNEGKYEEVCEVPSSLYQWAILDDHFIYRQIPTGSNGEKSSLCFYHLKDGTTTQVCEHAETFGIVEGKLQYITYGESYELHSYDLAQKRSDCLGSFSCELGHEYNDFNFTPRGLVMCSGEEEYNRSLAVYTPSSGTTAVYTLPKELHRVIAYDRYAYGIVYDTQERSSAALPSEENGVYRIDLTDGSYELVESEVDDHTEIHVVSDDRIYILQDGTNLLGTHRTYVYQLNCITGDKEKVMSC